MSRLTRGAATGLAALALAATAGLATAGQAFADVQSNQQWISDYYYIYNQPGGPFFLHVGNDGGQCLGANVINTYDFNANNTHVIMHDCDQTTPQLWTQQLNADGTWTFYVQNGGGVPFALDSQLGQGAGTAVETWGTDLNNPNNAQKWTIGPTGQLRSVDSGLCAQNDNGAITMQTCQ